MIGDVNVSTRPVLPAILWIQFGGTAVHLCEFVDATKMAMMDGTGVEMTTISGYCLVAICAFTAERAHETGFWDLKKEG